MSAIQELDETDPVLGHLLEILKAAPERDYRSAREGRSKFLAEMDELFPPAPVVAQSRHGAAAGTAGDPTQGWAVFLKSMFRPPRLVWAPITIGLTILFVLIFTGMATVSVAETALPGDTLYSLKTSIEQAELAVITDPVDEAALNLKYAERRLAEASALAANGRIGEAQALVIESDARMKSAYATMLTIKRTDPERAEQLRKMVQFRLNVLQGLVTNISASAPPALTPVLQSVITSVNSMAASADLPTPDPASSSPEKPPATGNNNANSDADANTNGNDNSDANANDVDSNDNDNDAPANNNGGGQENNNGGGQENNNGGGQENNNGDGPDNNNGGGQENNNGRGGGNSEDGSDNNNGGGQEGNNGNDSDSGDEDEDDNDGDKDKPAKPKDKIL